jgi:hypothetical protein
MRKKQLTKYIISKKKKKKKYTQNVNKMVSILIKLKTVIL